MVSVIYIYFAFLPLDDINAFVNVILIHWPRKSDPPALV